MEDMMAGVANDSLVTKQLENSSESGTIEALATSGDIDTRTGLLNALVICFKPNFEAAHFRWFPFWAV